MHMKTLAAAVSLACGTLITGGAQAAFPFDPVQVDLFQSGASAVQNNLKSQVPSLFQAGYKTACDNTTTNCSAFFAVTGTLANAAPVPLSIRGKTARIIYRTRGGSGWGVGVVARAQPIQWMAMNSATCSTTAPAGSTVPADYYCAPTGDDSLNPAAGGRVPDLGISDVEPKMFQAPLNVEFGQTQLDAFNLAGLTNFAVYQQAFGMPMTNVIPTSLRVDRLSLQSLLSKSGSMHDWTQVNGAPTALINPGSATKPVVVCRRVQGSGTQATANYFVNGFGCNAPYVDPSRMADSAGFGAQGTGSTASDPIVIDPSAGYTVVENPASGDVRSCLAAAQNGTNWKFKGDDGKYYEVTFSGGDSTLTTPYSNVDPTVVKPYGATGVLSYDSAGAENGWHFHDIDGWVAANSTAIDASGRPATSTAKYAVAGMVEGDWEYFSEESMQYRNGANGQPALTGDLKTLADGLIKVLGDPAVINANLGIAGLPNQYPPTMNVTTNKVAKGTKLGDTCKQKQINYTPQFWN